MMGFSEVQELVSFLKFFALRKGHLRETKKDVQSFKRHFEIEIIFFEQLQLYCLESNLFLHANPWKCKNRTFFLIFMIIALGIIA